MIELQDPYPRILLPSGKSLVDEYTFLKIRFEQPHKFQLSGLVVPESKDSNHFDYVFDQSITYEEGDDCYPVFNKQHTQEDEENLLTKLFNSSRYCSDESYEERFYTEMEFFIRNNHVLFLLKLFGLVEQFYQDGVVWGVGRGSSCASLVLFYIGIHDIDPMEFDISFRELSKESI